ncbi:MAG: phage holin family protein [Thermomicrobium sp.]|nr:phage holin family protein [Thermomicrobium sp.]MDW8059995.1 phage holin family protein [Thermomicrobium sp.]
MRVTRDSLWEFAAKAVVAVPLALWAAVPDLVKALVVLMALDILAGFLRAAVAGRANSGAMWKGLLKKALVLLVISTTHVIEPALGLPVSSAVAAFYVAHEALSITEHAIAAGVPVPDAVRRALQGKVPGDQGQGESAR